MVKLTFPHEKGGARTETQRKVAAKLVSFIVKRTARCTEAAVLEKAMAKYKKLCEAITEALDLKEGWKKPVKYWQHYISMYMSLVGTLTKNGLLSETESVKAIKTKVEEMVAKDKLAAGLKGKLKELEKIAKSS